MPRNPQPSKRRLEPVSLNVCSPSQGYLSPEEENALAMMRKIKADVADLKKRLARLAPDSREAETLRRALEKAQAEWKTWQARREEAYRAKMVFLGHQRNEK